MPNNLYFDTLFATSGDRTAVPDAPPGDGSVNYQTGYGVLYSTPVASGGFNFPRAQHNQLLNDITAAIQYIQQNGCANFITTAMNGGTPYSYRLGAIVSYDAGGGTQNWLSTAAANTTVPGAVGAHWSSLSSGTLFTGGVSTGTANAQLVVTSQGNFADGQGNAITWVAGFSVTAASTLAGDTATALAIKIMTPGGLRDTATGDIVAGGEYFGISDGTVLQLVNPTLKAGLAPLVQGSGKNIKSSWASTSTANITADQLAVQNAAGLSNLLTGISATLNIATSGANGIDTGSVAASTFYNTFIIWGTSGTACLASTSTTPTLPSGYTYYALIGVVLTDGSSHLVGFKQISKRWQYQVGNNLAAHPVMASGATASYPTPTAVALANFVPAGAASIQGFVGSGTNGTSQGCWTNLASASIGGGSNGDATSFLSGGGAFTGTGYIDMLIEGSNLYWASNSGGGFFACQGFTLG